MTELVVISEAANVTTDGAVAAVTDWIGTINIASIISRETSKLENFIILPFIISPILAVFYHI
jgi:hypothetical protein